MTVFTDPLGKKRQSYIDEKVYGIPRRMVDYRNELPALSEPAVIPINEQPTQTPGINLSTSLHHRPPDNTVQDEIPSENYHDTNQHRHGHYQDVPIERHVEPRVKTDEMYSNLSRNDNNYRSEYRNHRGSANEPTNEGRDRSRRLNTHDRGKNENRRDQRTDQRERDHRDSRDFRRNDYNKMLDRDRYNRDHDHHNNRDTRGGHHRDRHGFDDKNTRGRGSDKFSDSRQSGSDFRYNERRKYDDNHKRDSYKSNSRPRTPKLDEDSSSNTADATAEAPKPPEEDLLDSMSNTESSEALDLDSRLQMMLNRSRDLANFGPADISALPTPTANVNASTTPVLDEEPSNLPQVPNYPPPLPTELMFPGN